MFKEYPENNPLWRALYERERERWKVLTMCSKLESFSDWEISQEATKYFKHRRKEVSWEREEDEDTSEEGEEGWTKKAISSAFRKQICKCENEWRIDLKVETWCTTRLCKDWKMEGETWGNQWRLLNPLPWIHQRLLRNSDYCGELWFRNNKCRNKYLLNACRILG